MDALVSEFHEEVKKQRADLDAAAVRRRTWVGAAIAGALCLATWVVPMGRPGGQPAPEPERFSMASARLTLLLAARRVDGFKSQHGRLPTSLPDAGITEPTMTYERPKDGAYVIRIPVGPGLLTYDSSMAPALYTEDIKVILNSTGR